MTRSSIGRMLRSRRLAVWLLSLTAAWVLVGTVIPEGLSRVDGAGGSLSAVMRLAVVLGLDHPYSHPGFIGLLFLLAISTLLCAWERTRLALRGWRALGDVGEKYKETLTSRPHIRVVVRAGMSSDTATDRVEARLNALGLRTARGRGVVEAAAGKWGLFGSPLFHWTLALLIVVVAAGRLTRSEGLMGVPVGGSAVVAPESYGRLRQGVLFPGMPSFQIVVPEMDLDYETADGVDRGAAPVVVLLDMNGAEFARSRIYPNHPLRHGATMIHVSDYGYSPEISLRSATGQTVGTVRPIMDAVEGSSRSTTATIDLSGELGLVYAVELALTSGSPEPQLVSAVFDASTGTLVSEKKVAAGGIVELPTGDSLSFDRAGAYARLSIVHDWSVYPIYALFGIGLLGLSVAVLNPYRRVVVLIAEEGAEVALLAVLRHGRGSALFEARLQEALELAADAGPDDVA